MSSEQLVDLLLQLAINGGVLGAIAVWLRSTLKASATKQEAAAQTALANADDRQVEVEMQRFMLDFSQNVQGKLDNITEKYEAQLQRSADLREQLVVGRASSDAFVQQVELERKVIAAEKRADEERIARLTKDNKDLMQKLDTLRIDFEALQVRVAEVEARAAANQDALEAERQKRRAIEAERDQLRVERDALQARVTTLEAELATSKTTAQAQAAAIAALQQKLDSMETGETSNE